MNNGAVDSQLEVGITFSRYGGCVPAHTILQDVKYLHKGILQ